MKKLLILYGITMALASLLFGMERQNPAAVWFEPDGLEKIDALPQPSTCAIVLPSAFQPAGEQNQWDQSKKIKALLGSTFQFSVYKSLFPTVQNKWTKSHPSHHQLFILFRNLRL